MNKKPFCLAGMRHRSERGLVGPEWAMCCKIRTDNMCSAHIVILSCNIPLASNEAKWNWFIFLEQNVLPLNNSMAEAEVSLAQATPRSKELNAAHAESVQREKHVMKLTFCPLSHDWRLHFAERWRFAGGVSNFTAWAFALGAIFGCTLGRALGFDLAAARGLSPGEADFGRKGLPKLKLIDISRHWEQLWVTRWNWLMSQTRPGTGLQWQGVSGP